MIVVDSHVEDIIGRPSRLRGRDYNHPLVASQLRQ
jgi:hypothetical protein